MRGTDRGAGASSDAPDHAAQSRYITSTNAFGEKLPPVPAQTFTAERDRAFAPHTPTGAFPCDISDRLHAPVPATTPFLLARYLRVRAGESLRLRPRATATICYVIRGRGESAHDADRLAWAAGDIFRMPGGATVHRADEDAVLWTVSNEPEVAFHRLEPAASAEALEIAHFPAVETERRLAEICATPAPPDATGRVIIFTTAEFETMASLTPSMTVALNTLDPSQIQRAHRHNSVAVTLVLEGEHCHSLVKNERSDWQRYATMITPAASAHSHHNEGDKVALFLIVQDGGVFYQARTIGFAYA